MSSRIVNMTVPEALMREIDEVARVEGRTRSELFREAVRRYVKGVKVKGKDSSRLLTRLAALASEGPNISASDLDGLLYPKRNKR